MGARRCISQMPIVVDERLRERFWEKVRRLDGDNACWLWTGSGRGQGYGAIKIAGVVIDAHVASWRITNDGAAVPDGFLIAHRCDVRLCVRPDHLFLATTSQNMLDAVEKNRVQSSWQHGERAHNSVLTEASVREIRRLSADGFGHSEIAKQLALPHAAVRQVVRGRTWKHVV